MHRASLVLPCAFALLVPATARGDWPSARHDPQRSGVSSAPSDISNPTVYWKAFVGGGISPSNLLVSDVNLDGTPELVYVTGGAVVAAHANGQVVWQTPPHDFASLSAIDDFDGDKLPDVLVGGTSQAFLLRGKDGTIEWAEDPTDFGTLGGLRVADLNGDGRPDLVAEECHCCPVTNGASGFAYTFAPSNGAIASTKLWTYPPIAGDFQSCGVPTVVFDPVGNGTVAMAHAGISHMWIIGSDGTTLVDDTRSPAIGQTLYYADCVPADVDGVPGQELVCFQTVSDSVAAEPREPFVLHYDTSTTPPSINILWQNTSIAPNDLDFEPNAVVDLDGNGTKEVVVSGLNGSTWTTFILDAHTGSTLATIPNQRTAGTAALRTDGKLNVLTTDGNSITAWTFDATQQPPVTTSWSEPDRLSVTEVDPALLRSQRANRVLATPDLDQDGAPDLLASTATAPWELYDYSAAAGVPLLVGAFSFPNATQPLSTWTIPPTTQSYAQIATSSNDGFLRIFDHKLNAGTPIPVGGFCPAGFGNSPVVAAMRGATGPQTIFVPDSRGSLVRFDGQNAGFANPPKPAWSAQQCASPSVIPSLDGANPGIVCRSSRSAIGPYPTQSTLQAIRADGSVIWTASATGQLLGDALPGSPGQGGAPTVFAQSVDGTFSASVMAFSGSGTALWSTTPVSLQAGLVPFAVADWNGDGTADVVGIVNSLQALSGASGQVISSGTDYLIYGMPVLKDVNGDGLLEATVVADVYPARTYLHDMKTTLWTGANTQPIPAGAIADCPSGPQLIEGSDLYRSRLYLTQVSGTSAGTSTFSVLAGGKQYSSEAAATAAGAFLGQLSDTTIGTNLLGSGKGSAIVGSSDGWLYSVDPCTGNLQFVVPMGESVCGAVLGDTDGNGRDEILVGTAAGYLYDVQNEELPSPAPVIDTDPPHGITNKEVSTIVTQSTLYGAWQPVTGATGYQVAIVHQPDGIISNPAWQDAGLTSAGSVSGLKLTDGQTYQFAVHAVGPNGNSVDALSPGVTVIGPMDGGAGPGDAASEGGMGADAGANLDGGGDAGASNNETQTGGGGCGCVVASRDDPGAPFAFGLAVSLGAGLSARRWRRTKGRRQ